MARIMLIGSYGGSLIRFRGELLKAMVSGGHEVYACAPDATEKNISDLINIGVTYENFPLDRTGINPLRDINSLFAFMRLFRRIRPDFVLSYTIKPTIYGSIAGAVTRVAHVSSMITGLGYSFSSGSVKQRLVGRVVSLLYRIGLRFNRVVFFQNPDDLQFFREQGIVKDSNKPTLVNGSGVDLDDFSVLPMPSKTSFLLIARLIREKGIREYAEAARRLYEKYPEVKFCLVGGFDSNPTALTPSEITRWENEGIIVCLGKLDDVRPAIGNSTVFVLPSYYREGIPRTILEAMSMGRPIITTDAPGCRETVINGQNGFLVPTRDVESLAAAMERFILSPDLAEEMGAISRQLAERRFNVHSVNKTILGCLGLDRA